MDPGTSQLAKDYFDIEQELRSCSQGLKVLRDRKKKLGDALLQWLVHNNKKRVVSSRGVLEVRTAKKKRTLDKEYLHQAVLSVTGGNVASAEQIVNVAFNARPVTIQDRLSVKLKKESDNEAIMG